VGISRMKPTGLSTGMSDFDLLVKNFVRDVCRNTGVCAFVRCNCLTCTFSARLITIDNLLLGVLYCQSSRKVVRNDLVCGNWDSRLRGY
jgi:hypothetical protein